MTLATDEFIRRFLIYVLPKGLHRVRHYGLFANGKRAANITRARELLGVPSCSLAQRSERNNNSRPHWTAEHPRAARGAARPLWVSRARFPLRGSR